jgi:molecular chaperone DnaK
MVKDAESHAKEDDERRQKVEARNQLDSLVYQVEKDSAEWGGKISAGTRQRLEDAVAKAKQALKTDDAAAINASRDELMQAFSAAGQEMYQTQAQESQAAAPEPEPAGRPSGGQPDEEVVEADYEIVDEEK